MTTLLQIQPLPEAGELETWRSATWEEFVAIADAPTSAKLKSYYYKGEMRFEPMSTGSDHSKDNALILFALSFFAATQGLPITTKDGCSYRKAGFDEFQPDISCYVGAIADAIPWGTRVVNLDQYPSPSLVIEVSDTSLSDLRIPEYWVVNVQKHQILAFAIDPDGSTRRIQASGVIPGLQLTILAQALERSRQENQSATNAWLMQQLQG
jgi:Uma2 family endonuclease